MSGCANGQCGNHGPRRLDRQSIDGRAIEYAVRLPDGSLSEPMATLAEARQLAADTGGQARAMIKGKVSDGV